MNSQNFSAYAKSVGVIQGFICTIPLGGRLLLKQSAFVYPPLGTDTWNFVFLVMVLSGLAACLPWAVSFRKRRTKALLLWCSCLLLGCSVGTYFWLSQRYIVSVPLPDGGKLSVSVGSVRTPFAIQNFPGKTDAEMLMARGPYETDVQKLWTEDSIDSVRLRLFLSYLCALMLLNFVVGLIAKE